MRPARTPLRQRDPDWARHQTSAPWQTVRWCSTEWRQRQSTTARWSNDPGGMENLATSYRPLENRRVQIRVLIVNAPCLADRRIEEGTQVARWSAGDRSSRCSSQTDQDYRLRCRIFALIRRFLRPIFRRPLPVFFVPTFPPKHRQVNPGFHKKMPSPAWAQH